MGSSVDLHVRSDGLHDLRRLQRVHPPLELDPGAAFARMQLPPARRFHATDVLRMADGLRREVILLGFSSVSDSLQFTRCVPGTLLRHLQYGCWVEQGLWEEVEGEPEAWEERAFFDPKDFRPDPTDDPEYAAARQRLFETKRVRAGETLHFVDARESARAAAAHHRLTGWADAWR